MRCEIDQTVGNLYGPFTIDELRLIARLSGNKKWCGSGRVEFVPNEANKWIIKESGVAVAEKEAMPLASYDADEVETRRVYNPRLPLRKFQKECLALSWDKPAYAIFAEMGLGKTAIEIANIGMLYYAGLIDGVLIVAPNGVHEQWIADEFPKHADPELKYSSYVWHGNVGHIAWPSNTLPILAMNVDSLRIKMEKKEIVYVSPGFEAAEAFMTRFKRVIMIYDESHNIKNTRSQRTKAALYLGSLARYRRILTGTPIARDLMDAYAQFKFLDWKILGYRNIVAYRSHYCILGGFDNKQVIGSQNLEDFYATIAPYTYRKTKKEVTDLPDKIYVRRPYVMSETTKAHYLSMKNMWLTRFDDGEIKDAKNGIVAMLRLQQIVCGYLEREDGTMETIGNERLEAMLEIVDQVEGQVVIWARFTEDIVRISRALSEIGPTVTYYGEMSDALRRERKQQFVEGKARFFVGNIAMSTGLDGLQCAPNMIFYSNSFDALARWQSEDRAHRFGMCESLTIFDLTARGSIDHVILKNLREKKSLSDLSLDEIRQSLISE